MSTYFLRALIPTLRGIPDGKPAEFYLEAANKYAAVVDEEALDAQIDGLIAAAGDDTAKAVRSFAPVLATKQGRDALLDGIARVERPTRTLAALAQIARTQFVLHGTDVGYW